jgi:hypothetical protein
MRPVKLEDLNPRVRAMVAEALACETARGRPAPIDGSSVPRQPPTSPKSPRAKSAGRKLNKTETRFLTDWPPARPGFRLSQGVTLPFGDGTSYRPDVVLIPEAGGRPVVYEVKGAHLGKVAWSRHGVERFRRAREAFGRWLDFEMWQWSNREWRRVL